MNLPHDAHHFGNLDFLVHELAYRVATDGPAAHEPELADVARKAACAGEVPAVVEVLVDRTAPSVIRQRALGRVLRRLAGRVGPTPGHGRVTRTPASTDELRATRGWRFP